MALPESVSYPLPEEQPTNRVAWTIDPERAVLLVHDIGDVHQRSVAAHEFVFHGSLHQREMKTRGDSLILNPGEACGWMHGSPTAAIVDLDTRHAEFIKLDGPEWTF